MVLRLRQHNIGYTADGFYRSDDPTNSVQYKFYKLPSNCFKWKLCKTMSSSNQIFFFLWIARDTRWH